MQQTQMMNALPAGPATLRQAPAFIHGRAVAAGVIILSLSVLAFAVSHYQTLGESPDYQNYDRFLLALREYGIDFAVINRFEPGFFLLSLGLVSVFASNATVFSMMTAGAVLVKGSIVRLFTNSVTIVLVVAVFYATRYFPLHELTQIRASLAIAFLLLATWLIWNERRLWGVLVCCLAAAFHFSVLFVAPLLFIRPSKRTSCVVIATVIFVGATILGNIMIAMLEDQLKVIEMYQTAGFGEEPNLFSAALLLDWAMIITGMILWNTSTTSMKNVLFLQLVGMAIFYASVDFPVIAHRIREMISVFWVIYVVHGLQQRILARAATATFIFVNIALYSYLYIISDRLFSQS